MFEQTNNTNTVINS